MKKLAVSVALLALFAGCANIQSSSEGGHTVAVVENSGWFLLNIIPLASGNPEKPNRLRCKPFSDTVTLENNIKLLDRAVAEKGAKGCKDVVSYTTDEKIFVILLKRISYHTTAELIMPDANGADVPQ